MLGQQAQITALTQATNDTTKTTKWSEKLTSSARRILEFGGSVDGCTPRALNTLCEYSSRFLSSPKASCQETLLEILREITGQNAYVSKAQADSLHQVKAASSTADDFIEGASIFLTHPKGSLQGLHAFQEERNLNLRKDNNALDEKTIEKILQKHIYVAKNGHSFLLHLEAHLGIVTTLFQEDSIVTKNYKSLIKWVRRRWDHLDSLAQSEHQNGDSVQNRGHRTSTCPVTGQICLILPDISTI
jgi:hypothetical protein